MVTREKRLTLEKMGHIWKNDSVLKEWDTLEKWVTQNQSSKRKWATLEKRGPLDKMGNSRNNQSKNNWTTLGKMGHIYKYGPHLENRSKIKIWLTLGKWVTIGTMGRT